MSSKNNVLFVNSQESSAIPSFSSLSAVPFFFNFLLIRFCVLDPVPQNACNIGDVSFFGGAVLGSNCYVCTHNKHCIINVHFHIIVGSLF